ncbi:hypothetical protein ACMFMG_008993 [Clarireedia jacksonii]
MKHEVTVSKHHRPPPPSLTTKGRRQHTSSVGYTAFKIILKIVLVTLVICVALLPAAAVKNSHAIHSTLATLEPTVDIANFDIQTQADPYQGLLKNTSNLLVHQAREIASIGIVWLDDCVNDCISKQYGSASSFINCSPKLWSTLDIRIDNLVEAGTKCAQTCNLTVEENFYQAAMEIRETCNPWAKTDVTDETSETPEKQYTKRQVEQTEVMVEEYERNRKPLRGPSPMVHLPLDRQKRSEEAKPKYCPIRSRIRGTCKKRIHSETGDQDALHTRPLRRTNGIPSGAEPGEIQTCSYTAKIKNGGTCPEIPSPEFFSNPHIALSAERQSKELKDGQLSGFDISDTRVEKRCNPCAGNELDFLKVDDITQCPCEDLSVKAAKSISESGNSCPTSDKHIDNHCGKDLDTRKPVTPQSKIVLENLAQQHTLINGYLHGTKQNGHCDVTLFSKPAIRVRELWPTEWIPKTEEDCDRFRTQVYKYNECLKEVGHRNIGLKMILGFLMLAGVSVVVFFIVTCIRRAVRPKAKPFTAEEMEAGGRNWYRKGGAMHGDRWARGMSLPDEMRMAEDSCTGHNLVECSTSTGDEHGNVGVNAKGTGNGNGDGWKKRSIPKRGGSLQVGRAKEPCEPGTGTKGGMQKQAPRIPSLQLPRAGLATVRKSSGLAEGTIGRNWRKDGYEGKGLGGEDGDRHMNASEVTVVVAREHGIGTDTVRKADTMTEISTGVTVSKDTNAVL